MRCEYVLLSINDEGKHVCQCVVCRHYRTSKYPPDLIHRNCPAQAGGRAEFNLDCTHRGPAIDTHTCQLCGNRGKEIEVYSCDLHGKCVLRRWSNRNQEAKEGERICLICADRG